MKCHAILGPPGTGKTTRLVEYLQAEVAGGIPLARIGLLTFTRAARGEALDDLQERLHVEPEEVPWVRTIHAAALSMNRSSSVRRHLLSDRHWAEFAKLHGYKFSGLRQDRTEAEADVPVPPRRTEDDALRFVYDWGRNRRLHAEKALGACPVASVQVDRFRLFVRRYEAFKAEHGLLDFVDLLEHALQAGTALPVDVGFVDEAQDLSALQAEVVEMFFANCERLYLAGDDDQAVYVFQGGCAEWFMRQAREGTSEVLSRSHRVPAVVKALADSIIGRNQDRLDKPYAPSNGPGRVLRVSQRQAMDLVDGTRATLVLARNRMFLHDHACTLLERNIPYVIDGDGSPNPLGSPRLVRAINTAQLLRSGEEPVRTRDLADLLNSIPASSGLVPTETRRRLGAMKRSGLCCSRAELVHDLGLGPLLELLQKNGTLACLPDIARWKAQYFEALLERFGNLPKPRIVLTSIHAAKGRQADLVVVLPDMTRRTYAEYTSHRRAEVEAENRVFYVAVTRTRSTLVLVDPKTRRHFDHPKLPQATGRIDAATEVWT